MKTLDITKEALPVADCVRALEHGPLVLLEEGRPVAVLVPVQGADLETVSLSLSQQFQAILQRSGQRRQEEGGVSGEEMRRRLGIEPPVGGPKARGGK